MVMETPNTKVIFETPATATSDGLRILNHPASGEYVLQMTSETGHVYGATMVSQSTLSLLGSVLQNIFHDSTGIAGVMGKIDDLKRLEAEMRADPTRIPEPLVVLLELLPT